MKAALAIGVVYAEPVAREPSDLSSPAPSNDVHWFDQRERWYGSVIERFLGKLVPEPNTGCLLWSGAVDKDGYGKFQVFLLPQRKQVHVRAHAFALALRLGRWPRLNALHTCDTPACANGEHLVEGTQAKNIADKVRKGRQASGCRHGSKTRPDCVARGSRHGSVTHPECVLRGDAHPRRRRPDLVLSGDRHPGVIISDADMTLLMELRGQCPAAEAAVRFGVKPTTVYKYWKRGGRKIVRRDAPRPADEVNHVAEEVWSV